MTNSNTNFSFTNKWVKRLIYTIGIAGIIIFTDIPVFPQASYPLINLFQPNANSDYFYRNGNLVDSLENNPDFENLVAEIESAGLTEKLKKEELTLLAPSDDAFNALSDDVFERFSESKNRQKVLQYHLISGKVSQKDIDRGKVQTLAGEMVTITSDKSGYTLNNALPIYPPTVASNGVIIEIDRVLLPPGF